MKPAIATKALFTIIALILMVSACDKSLDSLPGARKRARTSRFFLGGQIQVDSDFQAFENSSFACTPAQPLRKGDVLAANVSGDEEWSLDTGGPQHFPIVGMVKTSDAKFHALYPAVLKVKTDIKPGAVLHAGGYQIEAKRQVKSGESISVLVVGDGILSVEAVDDAGSKPWFAAFKDDMTRNDRASAIETWGIGRADRPNEA